MALLTYPRTAKILRDAASLIEEKGWTQNAFARDAEGNLVPSWSGAATCYCASGALRAVAPLADQRADARRVLRDQFATPGGDRSIPNWNDHPDQTAENVVATFDTYETVRRNGKLGYTTRRRDFEATGDCKT